MAEPGSPSLSELALDGDGVYRLRLEVQAAAPKGLLCTVRVWDRTEQGLRKRLADALRQCADGIEGGPASG